VSQLNPNRRQVAVTACRFESQLGAPGYFLAETIDDRCERCVGILDPSARPKTEFPGIGCDLARYRNNVDHLLLLWWAASVSFRKKYNFLASVVAKFCIFEASY
jgi:hypothetical protein